MHPFASWLVLIGDSTPDGIRVVRPVHEAISPPPAFRVSGLGSRVSGLRSRVSGFGFWVLSFGFRVSGLGFRVLCLGSRVRASGFGFRVSGFEFRVPGFGFGFQVSGSRSQVSGVPSFRYGMRVSDFELRVWGFISGFELLVWYSGVEGEWLTACPLAQKKSLCHVKVIFKSLVPARPMRPYTSLEWLAGVPRS